MKFIKYLSIENIFCNFSQASLIPRSAGPIEPGDCTAGGAVLPTPTQVNIRRSDCSISVLEILAPRSTNLQFKKQPPLTSIENVINPPTPKPNPVIGGVIIHVKPAVNNILPSQIPP